jgi:hypothetical protein
MSNSNIPSSMKDNWTYECPLTGKTFGFSQGDKASKREALAAQQAHTGAETQRLERLAGRQLTYREWIHSSRMERTNAATKEAAQPETPKPADEPHPFVKHVYEQAFGHLPVVS